jgi:hypothetical protein
MPMDKGLHLAILGLGMSLSGAADVPRATDDIVPGVYRLTAQTLLPHLEESLRYATTVSETCLGRQSADSLFPLLRHEAFAGCVLVHAAGARDAPRSFDLACRNAQAATGRATVEVSGESLVAVLQVKMGGKNMTLSQRVHGPWLRRCGVGD